MASESAPCRLLRSFTLSLSLLFVFLAGSARAEITVVPGETTRRRSPPPWRRARRIAAWLRTNPTTLSPPPLPTPSVLTTIPINLQNSGTPNLGIKQKGSFIGFSIEMSVTNQVLGKNSTLIQVPFLNLIANIQQRAGSVMIRVGGNTQRTPPLEFNRDLLYMMRNISGLFVTTPFNTGIITAADEILGDYLLGLQAGNEPDMYNLHGHRGSTSRRAGRTRLAGDEHSGGAQHCQFRVDARACVELGAGIRATNCAATFGGPGANVTDPQSVLPLYLTHDAHTHLLAPYLNSTMYAQSVGKPFLMFETNTASCGGFLGVSDSFTAGAVGARLRAADGALEFLGRDVPSGQPKFVDIPAPPTNESTFHQWSVGPLYYSALVMAEAIGPSNNTQVVNYGVADLSPFTPIYGIYENGTPVRVAVFNYLDDPSGANTVHAVISIAGTTMPSSVKTFGGFFESDGRPTGQEDIQTVQCDTTAQTCTVDVPAPGFALVFLTDDAFTESKGAASVTFPTTAQTKTRNTGAFYDGRPVRAIDVETGYRMADHELAGTSKAPSAAPRGVRASLVTVGVIGVTTVLAILGRAM
ncbi:glycoside hydrolase family 79 protein [Mycena olivaceomarginata]|nr:glycoside hydrolase family 79 protein [Mycena olivaceomarginata]